MADLTSRPRGPGFQRSETSSAHMRIYEQPPDPVLGMLSPDAGSDLRLWGRGVDSDLPSLIELQTSKSLGAPSGTWSAIVKSGRTDLRRVVADDAWVDIEFSRHGRRYFTMRGSIDDIRRQGRVGGDGATTATYTITGRDFGKVWELTPLWFNKYVDSGNPPENVAGAAAMRVFTSLGLGGQVNDVVLAYLQGFLKELGKFGRANWQLPPNMPGVEGSRSFIENVTFDPKGFDNVVSDYEGFTNKPPRIAIAPNFLDPSGANLWVMAQEWSDPAFVEMFSDLSDGVFNTASDQLDINIAKATVFLRDRPFPTLAMGLDSPWFRLPTVELPREDIVADDLGRSGGERFNAYFVSPEVLQEFMSGIVEVTAPLWDAEDMLVHGFRRYDINSRYQLDVRAVGAGIDDSLLTLTKAQRRSVRDWYCLNPYFHNGTIECGRGVLEARVGRRLRIPGRGPQDDLTAYIEQVSHHWRFGQGVKSTLGITRGWYGTDASYLDALTLVAARYAGNRQDDADVSAEALTFAGGLA